MSRPSSHSAHSTSTPEPTQGLTAWSGTLASTAPLSSKLCSRSATAMRERKDQTSLLPQRPPPLPSTSMTQYFVVDYIHLEVSGGVGSSSTASLPTLASNHRPRRVLHQLWRVLHQRPRQPPCYSDHYVRLRGRLLDKSHNSASLYLSILLVRARYSPPG